MITVGLDDTDTLDSPGTNQLARHIVAELNPSWKARVITRHQLLEDPRVPCTKRNGCVAIEFAESAGVSIGNLAAVLKEIVIDWCPTGSDPGLCIIDFEVPESVLEFGRRCQSELVTQTDARELAATHGIQLNGLGGTEDGVIGALAAVGLHATRNSGRVIYWGAAKADHFDISGAYPVGRLAEFGVDEVRQLDSGALISAGTVSLGKRLRPNYRQGKVVLYVSPSVHPGTDWLAERVL